MLKRSALLIAFVFIGGCLNNGDSQLPAHFPANGEITQDGKPVGAGFVRFHPSGNEEYTVDGEVDAFGKFELVTTLKDKKVKGAPPGTYSVTFTANADPKVKRAATKSSFQIEAKANDLTVELEERK